MTCVPGDDDKTWGVLVSKVCTGVATGAVAQSHGGTRFEADFSFGVNSKLKSDLVILIPILRKDGKIQVGERQKTRPSYLQPTLATILEGVGVHMKSESVRVPRTNEIGRLTATV